MLFCPYELSSGFLDILYCIGRPCPPNHKPRTAIVLGQLQSNVLGDADDSCGQMRPHKT